MLNQSYNPIDGVSFVTTCNVLILVVVDYICCLYGTPSAYGVVTMPFSVREGINVFLAGFVPTENLRFRDEELNFKLTVAPGE
jgi:translation initiation factor RLI1